MSISFATGIQPHYGGAAATYSTSGRHYDRISRSIADSIEHCVFRLDPQPGERILDLSPGTGWTSRLVARRGARVIGVDIAPAVLEAARAQAALEGLPIVYQIGDAERLPFETGAFDAVVSAFGVMFASRPEAAAAELARVCRAGGRVAITTWLSDGNLFRMFEMMRRHLPPASLTAHSPFEWGRTDRIQELLGDAFHLRFEQGVSYYREPTAEAAWETFSSGHSPTRALALTLDDAKREALRRDFIAFHAGFPTQLGICVPRAYWLTVGIRA